MRRVERVIVLAAASLLATAAVWACGPFFPRWLITDEPGLLGAPATWFQEAVESIRIVRRIGSTVWYSPAVEDRNRFKAVVDAERGPYRQTADVDLHEVEAATSDRHLTARYGEVRDALLRYTEEVSVWRREYGWTAQPPPPPEPPQVEVPAGLPGEFADYLAGAIAYHQGQLHRAGAIWEALLDRPAGERRQRSTWAAFMLGKASLAKDPTAASKWFERTRELAAEGYADPLGLAASSLGWQARAEISLKHWAPALTLYFKQTKTGDPTALNSLRATSARALADPSALKQIAGADEARPILTAYVISLWKAQEHGGLLDPAPARTWMKAIRDAGVQDVEDADRLAWVAYRAGDFTAAEEWLKKARGRPMTSWIEAKLLMRAGKLPEAELSLLFAQHTLAADPGLDHDAFQAYESGVPLALRPRVEGERGAVQLAQGNYTEAVSSLLAGGYWSDAAYVAERVLTTDELIAYAGRAWPAALAAHRPVDYGDGWTLLYGGLVTPSKERTAYSLRYLLGRRLVREERYREAEKYLPTLLQLHLHRLARSLAAGNDAGRPAAERSQALFDAACVTRYQGLELLGTELEPDWFVFGGQLETDPLAKARTAGAFQHLGPTANERERAGRTGVKPWKRFHYRYLGADLARSAADLLPAGTLEKARILATAGNWLEGRDPEAAKPFYDAILACCGDADLGRRARNVKAIPNIPDACPAETRNQTDGGR